MKELIRKILREQTAPEVASGYSQKLKNLLDNMIFYLPGDKKWEYNLRDDIWHTRRRDSNGKWLSLGGEKFKDTVIKLNKVLLHRVRKPKTSKTPNTDICTFIIPVAWPNYTPKVESDATDTDVWMARIYAALTNRDYESKEENGTTSMSTRAEQVENNKKAKCDYKHPCRKHGK